MRQTTDIQAIDERKVIQLVLQFPTDSLLTGKYCSIPDFFRAIEVAHN